MSKGGRYVITALGYLGMSIFAAVVWYLVFAFVFSTPEERRLRRENNLYEKIYPGMEEKAALISSVIASLEVRDNDIYKDIFHAEAPRLNMDGSNILSGDTVSSRRLVSYCRRKSISLLATAENVEENFRHVFERCSDMESLPPLSLPVEGVSYAQIGASVGDKINPFYKVPMKHDGLDIIAPQGDPVYSVAPGTVTRVEYSRKGKGNMVELDHGNGFITRYSHLSDVDVRRGQRLDKGRRIGSIGISGVSFAPHLHYEVIKDSVNVDPVNYFLASVTPGEYVNMLYMSVQTGQSMD